MSAEGQKTSLGQQSVGGASSNDTRRLGAVRRRSRNVYAQHGWNKEGLTFHGLKAETEQWVGGGLGPGGVYPGSGQGHLRFVCESLGVVLSHAVSVDQD